MMSLEEIRPHTKMKDKTLGLEKGLIEELYPPKSKDPKVEVITVILEDEVGEDRYAFIKEELPDEKEIRDKSLIDGEHDEIWVKNYSLTALKEKPIDNVMTLFNDNLLDYERLQLHQRVFNKILENQSRLTNIRNLHNEYTKLLKMEKTAEAMVYSCSFLSCQYQTMDKTNLKSHLVLTHKSELKYKMLTCKTCFYSTKTLTDLKQHMLATHPIHGENYNFRKCSPEQRKVKNEVRRRKEIKCSLCSFQTENKSLFTVHEASHRCSSNPRNYACYLCGYVTKRKLYLKMHLLQMHKIKTLGLGKLTHLKFKTDLAPRHLHQAGVRKYMCEICGKKFPNSTKLHFHSLTHKSIEEVEQIFQCQHCKYKSKFKGHLMIHMQVHKGFKFKCEVCGYMLRRKWNYENHLLTHLPSRDVQTYECDLCSYRTNFQERLQRHLQKGDHTRNYVNSYYVRKTQDKQGELFECSECRKATRVKVSDAKNSAAQLMFCVTCCKITDAKKVDESEDHNL